MVSAAGDLLDLRLPSFDFDVAPGPLPLYALDAGYLDMDLLFPRSESADVTSSQTEGSANGNSVAEGYSPADARPAADGSELPAPPPGAFENGVPWNVQPYPTPIPLPFAAPGYALPLGMPPASAPGAMVPVPSLAPLLPAFQDPLAHVPGAYPFAAPPLDAESPHASSSGSGSAVGHGSLPQSDSRRLSSVPSSLSSVHSGASHAISPAPSAAPARRNGGMRGSAAKAPASAGSAANGGSQALKSEATMERIRAKNRRAQSRYRAKLKNAAQATTEQYDAAAEELARLRLENATLSESNAVMEKVLEVRDQYVAVLSASGRAEGGARGRPSGRAPTHDERLAIERSACLGPDAAGRAGSSHGASSQSTDTAVEGGKIGGYGSGSLPDNGREGASHPGAPRSTCPYTGLSPEGVQAVKQCSPAVVREAWRALVPKLEDALVQARAPGGDLEARAAARDAVTSLLQQARAYCFEHALHNPSGIQRLLAGNLGQDAAKGALAGQDATKGALMGQPASAEHWARVAEALALSPEQLEAFRPLRQVFVRRIARTMEQRQDLLRALGAEAGPAGATVAALRQQTARWLRAHALTSELGANLAAEHVACMEFVSRTFGALLTCEQKAVAIVQSYPFFPDTYAIATVAIARAGGSLEVSGIEREALAHLDAKVFSGVRCEHVAEAGSAVDAS